MPEKGWIKLHRKILDCWIWQDKPYDKARAWVDLLLLAMHHDKKMLVDDEILVVSRGSFMTSIVKLSERWGWSRNKVTRYLQLLESEQMLNTKRTPKGTLVTIVKYEDYQLLETASETSHETANEAPLGASDETQNKNVKNYKNVKNNIVVDIQTTLDAWNELKTYGIKTVSKMSSSSQRYQRLSARINEYGVESVLLAINKIKESDFLVGKNNRGWTITFDWFVLPNNFPKVLDGNYDNKNGGLKHGCIGSDDAKDETDGYADAFYGAFGQ